MKGAIWFALAADYRRTKWLRSEREAVKSAWVSLLALVKEAAPRKGSIEFKDWDDLAYRMHFHPDDYPAVERMISLAAQDGAITLDGRKLTITNWKTYQFGGQNQPEDTPEPPKEPQRKQSPKPAQTPIEPDRTPSNDVEPLSTELNAPEPDRTPSNDIERDLCYVHATGGQEDSKTEEKKETTSGGEEEGCGEKPTNAKPPPRGEFSLDPLAEGITAGIRASRGYEHLAIDPVQVQELVKWVREFAPDDQSVLDTVEAFRVRASGRRTREYDAPIVTLRSWMSRDEANWRRIRRERERDAKGAGLIGGEPGELRPIEGVDYVYRPCPEDRNGPAVMWDKATGERWSLQAWRSRQGKGVAA